MYSVLLVDDDKLELETLKNYVDWSRVGIDKVYTARSSKSALACIAENEPDIMITDIQMPGMSGTELARTVREEQYNCKIVFLTAYDQFEYAKVAIQVQAEDYLLKPFQVDEVEALTEKIVQKIKKEKMSVETENIALGRILEQICNGVCDNIDEYAYKFFERKASEVKFSLIAFYALTDEQKKTLYSMKNKIHCFEKGNFIICIYHDAFTPDMIYSQAKRIIGGNISAVSYRECVRMDNLKELCEELVLCEEMLFFEKDEKLLYSDERKTYSENVVIINENEIRRNILYYMRTGIEQETYSDLDKLLGYYKGMGKDLFIQRCVSLLEYFDEHIKSETHSDGVKKPDILHLKSYVGACSAFHEYAKECINLYCQGNDAHIANWVKAYMMNHYSEVCSVEEMAELLNISPNYLRSKFKSQTGRTILEYLTDLRLAVAKELLKEGKIKVKDVSVKVGYDNISYFTQLFSKKYGVTPNEYKKMV